MRYLIIIRKTDTGYSADAPDLPGCVAAAKTVERTHRSMARAVSMHIELMRQSGERVPPPRRRVEVRAEAEGDEEFYTWVEVERAEPAALAKPRRRPHMEKQT